MSTSEEELKKKGNQSFAEGNYTQAICYYTEALNVGPDSHLLLSNRSAACNKLGKYDDALRDAISCISQAPSFARGYLRKATALNGLGKHTEAIMAAEDGYRLRGSHKICKDCVAEWMLASTNLLQPEVNKLDEVLPGATPISEACVKILLSLEKQHGSAIGVSINFMEDCLHEAVCEFECLLKRFGHSGSLHLCAHEWVACLIQALKPNPRNQTVSENVVEALTNISSKFAACLKSDIDPALYPIIGPVVCLCTLVIFACVSTLSQVISNRDGIQILIKSCLPLYSKSILSEQQQYHRLYIHGLELLLNSFCMESAHARQRDEKERQEIKEYSQILKRLIKDYPSSYPDHAEVTRSSQEVLESVSILVEPVQVHVQAPKRLTKEDVEIVKSHVAKELITLEELQTTKTVLNLRDMDTLVLSTGGLVELGEVDLAKKCIQRSETLYFEVMSDLMKNKLVSVNALAQVLFHPHAMMLANGLFLCDVDDNLFADIYIRWKCVASELYAILARLGIGSSLLSTFKKIEQLRITSQGKSNAEQQLTDLAHQYENEVNIVMQEWGPKVVLTLKTQSYEQIQRQLEPDQVVLEYCMSPLYDTKCHPVPIPPNVLTVSGVLLVVRPHGPPIVRMLNFGKIQELCVKSHDSAMRAVGARRAGKNWEQLQAIADNITNSLLKELFPADIQALLSSPLVKRIVYCPDPFLAKFPLEILMFDDGKKFGDKFAITYLSSGREILREQTLSSLNVELAKPLSKECVIFANPNYNLEKPETDDAGNSTWSWITSTLTSLFSVPLENTARKVEPLPGSAAEAAGIKSILTSTQCPTSLFLGDEATVHKALQLESPRILHFATHSFSNPDFQHQYRNFWTDTRSGLLLAGANTYCMGKFNAIANKAGTGHLSALAACGMSLGSTRLVYLSSCRSLYGYIGRGEALSSLAQGFRTAGVQTVIATLWPVSDKACERLAHHFYCIASQAGVHPSLALKQAKQLLQQDGFDCWYDWAAFLCIGLDTPIF